MALGFGASKSRSNSQSSSLDLGFNQASSLSESLGTSQSTSSAQSFSDALAQSLAKSGGQSTSTQQIFNADVLKKLYGDAIAAGGNVDTGLFQGQAAELYGSGLNILDSLGVGAGEDYLQSRLTDTSARDAQLGALQSGLGTLFREELNPAITARHVAGGTLGGGRQGVAQAGAIGKIAQQYQQGAADILSRDQLARDAAAGTLMAGRTQAAGVGASLIPGLAGVAGAGLDSTLSPYATLASILGGPFATTTAQSTNFGDSSSVSTQTGRSVSESQATSEQIARAISEALGFNYGTSQSTSSSKSGSFSFGL